jgi:alanine racemase
MHGLTALVDLQSIRDNLRLIRALAAERAVMACVKGNAYGHGLVPVARCLEQEGVEWLTLGSRAEAIALREAGITARVLLFPTIADPGLASLARRDVTIGVQSSREAAELARAAACRVSVFLKVDGGFGRVGTPLDDAVAEARAILRDPALTLDGVFTHLPFGSAESVPWIQERYKAFGTVAAAIQEDAGRPLMVQALASTGLACGLDAPSTTAVCPGSLLYGLQPAWTSDAAHPAEPPVVRGLRAALVELTTMVGSLRSVPPGTRFGPGGVRIGGERTMVGVLPVGFSNSILLRKPGQHVYVAGRPAPVLSVSLEHTVIDVSDVPGVVERTPVQLLARDPARGPSLEAVAQTQGRATVEVLVALTGRTHYEYRPDTQ